MELVRPWGSLLCVHHFLNCMHNIESCIILLHRHGHFVTHPPCYLCDQSTCKCFVYIQPKPGLPPTTTKEKRSLHTLNSCKDCEKISSGTPNLFLTSPFFHLNIRELWMYHVYFKVIMSSKIDIRLVYCFKMNRSNICQYHTTS